MDTPVRCPPQNSFLPGSHVTGIPNYYLTCFENLIYTRNISEMKILRNTSLLWTLPQNVIQKMASYLDPISREAFYSVWTNVEYVNYIPNKWVLAPQNNMSIFIEKEEEEQAYQKIQKIHSGSYGIISILNKKLKIPISA